MKNIDNLMQERNRARILRVIREGFSEEATQELRPEG